MIMAMIMVPAAVAGAVGAGPDSPFTKLGRGFSNTFTGWMELPITMHRSCAKYDLIHGIIMGFPIGLFKALLRTGTGLYEIVTFGLPWPNNYNEPIVEPEFVAERLPTMEKMRPEEEDWENEPWPDYLDDKPWQALSTQSRASGYKAPKAEKKSQKNNQGKL